MAILRRLLVPVTLGLLAGSAALAQAPTQEAQTFLRYAGPLIDEFTYLGHYHGVRMLGGPYFALWTTDFDGYLIKVKEPCPNLPFADKLDLTSAARTVNRKFDRVIVGGHEQCQIDTIQHLDIQALKKAHIVGP